MPRSAPTLGSLFRSTRPKDTRESAAKRGYGRRWQRLRAMVLLSEPLCRECKSRGRVVAATDVDHIKSKERGGQDEISNLQALCHSCHSVKTAKEDGSFGRK